MKSPRERDQFWKLRGLREGLIRTEKCKDTNSLKSSPKVVELAGVGDSAGHGAEVT